MNGLNIAQSGKFEPLHAQKDAQQTSAAVSRSENSDPNWLFFHGFGKESSLGETEVLKAGSAGCHTDYYSGVRLDEISPPDRHATSLAKAELILSDF